MARFPDSPEVRYNDRAKRNFYGADSASEPAFLHAIATVSDVTVDAPPDVVVHEARIGGRSYLFLQNFAGLEPGQNETPSVRHDIRITVKGHAGSTLHVLPLLGTESEVVGKHSGEVVQYDLPPLERGAVAWFQRTKAGPDLQSRLAK
jgi:hypothetical protein